MLVAAIRCAVHSAAVVFATCILAGSAAMVVEVAADAAWERSSGERWLGRCRRVAADAACSAAMVSDGTAGAGSGDFAGG